MRREEFVKDLPVEAFTNDAAGSTNNIRTALSMVYAVVWPHVLPVGSFDQDDICKDLGAELGASRIGMPDRHGNTMLHYLAGAREPSQTLISWLKLQATDTSVWQNAANLWGHTPQDLYEDSETARIQTSEGRKDWFGRDA